MIAHPFIFSTLAVAALTLPLAAQTLRIDFNSNGTTQSGWQSLASGDSDLGDSWSKNFSGGVSLDVDAIGSINLDDRDRSNNGGGGEASMWRDFLFANGSFNSNPGSGLRLAFTGLQPNAEYPVKIWGYDVSSSGGRAADWSGGGAATQRLTFTSQPATLADNVITLNVTTDGSGAVTLNGIVSVTNPNSSHNVFINGLEIGDPVATDGPNDLALSSLIVAKSATIGSAVGTFTTTDPTPGDTFIYSLEEGAGSSDNGLFEITGDTLRVDRDLSELVGGAILSIRVRTADIAGTFYEEVFNIEVVNDSDNDGLDDDWELLYFPALTTASGDDDGDNDDLTNIEEQSAGTNPTMTDTDGDTLTDGQEINTFGTNPLLADTDGEGLSDADELSGTGGFVTDPKLADTDGDGFNDALELSEGTDPTNTSDFPNTLLPLRLNEILTRNVTNIQDGFGRREDWIEIYNPNNQAVNLDGYYLTDSAGNPTKWNFPNITISAQGYLVVFASGEDTVDPDGNAHTNFSLSTGGEYLAIVRPNGTTVDDSFSPAFPEQFTDTSYGVPSGGGQPVFFQSTTPGSINSASAFPGVVKDTNFMTDRGFYTDTFQLVITSDTPGATIRYTLDGTPPTPTSGTVYTGPITISTTSTVRALATFSDWLPTNVDTHTYIFIEDVVQQPTDPPGWPSDWGFDSQVGQNVASDYEMDPRVVNNTNGLGVYTVQEALLDIPTVAISMRQEDITGGSGGVLTNPRGRFERPCSIEYIFPDGTTGFQEDCKIETQGNSSRTPNRMQKHSMRVTFTSEFGIPKLDYPLFEDSEVETFNKLVLRACFTDSWALNTWSSSRYRPNDSQYTRDVWMKDSMTDLGHASGHGRFVHLYYNGLYFGVHDLTERIEDDWYAEHLGGREEDWRVNKDHVVSEAGTRWNAMTSLLNGNITDNGVYDQVKDYIDLDNYIDYMLLHFYADAEDWPTKNGYGAVNEISGDGKFRFQVWDQEIALDKFSWNRYDRNSGSGAPFQRLRLNDEFRILFADRVHKHMFNGGALSESESVARYLKLADEIDKAIVAESARWGDTQDNTPYGNTASSSNNIDADYYPPTINDPIYFTREQHWVVERDVVTNHYIPILHDESDSRSIVRELRARNLYPSIDPPIYAQHGGIVSGGFDLAVTASEGNIYYTTDGSDPRLAGGGINPSAGMLTGGVLADTFLDFEATGWRFLDNGVAQSNSNVVVGNGSYNATDWKHPDFNDNSWGTGQAMLGYGAVGSVPIRTTVGPAGTPRNITTYFRKEFSVSGAADYTELTFDLIRDDGAIVYLNGKEIDRSNLADGVITATSLATSASPEDEIVPLSTLTLAPGDLVEGVNVIAVEVHQTSTRSSDLGVDLRVRGIKPNPGASDVTLTETGTLKARSFSGGEWSALTEADFIVGIPASPSNLVVSEINYNPAGVDDTKEWLELMNISATAIDLTDVSFTGITYAFPAGTTLEVGQRIVIVKDQAGFAADYDTTGILIAPGVFTGSLNNGGEELAIIDATGTVDIQRFTYLDEAPWPTAPDGTGATLVLVSPQSSPAHGDPASWRSSFNSGGSPGGSDGQTFTGDPNADLDGDGLTALLEYAFGSINGDAGPSPESVISVGQGLFGDPAVESLAITFRRNLAAEDVIITVEGSADLVDWDLVQTQIVSAIPNGDGTETVTYRSLSDIAVTTREFIRVKVTQSP